MDRFWNKVDKREPTECWNWLGFKHKGYGQISYMGRPIAAPRLAFLLTHGYMPTVVRHTCDNPACVNPAHLLNGTHQDNVRDRVQRGRTRTGHCYGEQHANHKLTIADVRAIRLSTETATTLGKRLGVDRTTINQVRKYKTWRNV